MKDIHHPCECWAEQISLAAAGCLAADEETEVRRHAESCEACRERLLELTGLCNDLAEARVSADNVETIIVDRVMAAVSERPVVRRRMKNILPRVVFYSFNTWRWMMRSPVSRIVAAAVFVLAVTGVFLWLHGGGATVTFAQVAEKFLKVKSYKLKVTNLVNDQLLNHYDRMWIAPGRSREESKNKDGVIDRIIIREGNSERLQETTLWPVWKQADLMTFVNLPKREPFFDEAHSLMLKARDNKMEVNSLGEKVIEGRRAIGYRLKFEKYSAEEDIWADVETLLPVRIEIANVLPKKSGVMKSIWSDIQYNLNLDDSLFSLDPPKGYKVRKHKQHVLPKQENQPAGESNELSPMNYGPVTPLGEVEEEGSDDAKGSASANSGKLVPTDEVQKEGEADAPRKVPNAQPVPGAASPKK